MGGKTSTKPDNLCGQKTLFNYLELKNPAPSKPADKNKGEERNILCKRAAELTTIETDGMTTEAENETGHRATQLQWRESTLLLNC